MNIDDLIIQSDISVFDAMHSLETTGRRILFIAPEGRLEAVLTDSDVRKFILRGGNLNQPVSEAANYKPKSLPVDMRSGARVFLQQNVIDAVPLLDKKGRIVDVVFANDTDDIRARATLDIPVVIMAGGLGTRLYPYTKILPKPLIPVGESPIIELVIRNFHDFGCQGFTLVLNHKRNMIKSYFADVDKDYFVDYIDEEEPLGTGGGPSLLKGRMNGTFFLTNCDILVDADYSDILNFHRKQGNDITMVCAMKRFTIPYGVVELCDEGQFSRIAEKPMMDYLINTGMYVVEPSVVEHTADGVKQGFTDIIEQCRQRGGSVGVYPISEGSWMDMGQIEELELMRRRMEQSEQ